jgi:hypothetical protein
LVSSFEPNNIAESSAHNTRSHNTRSHKTIELVDGTKNCPMIISDSDDEMSDTQAISTATPINTETAMYDAGG